jgi:hypothetical protein
LDHDQHARRNEQFHKLHRDPVERSSDVDNSAQSQLTPVTVSFFFTDTRGNFGSGSTIIPANGQLAKFLNESPFNGPSSLSGTFTFTSSVPVSVIVLRGLTNERSEFLVTTLTVADLSAPAATDTIVLPHFADGGGWTTQIILVNPSDGILTGAVRFLDRSGMPPRFP